MEIKTLDEKDVDGVYEIERACFFSPWEKSVICGTVLQPSYRFFGVYENGCLCGYGSVTNICGECYVNRIAVKSEYRRNGCADMLMDKIIAYCKDNNAEFLSLEVRKSNDKAIGLYNKHGLKPVGERKNFYQNPTENALIMTLKFM